MLRKEGLITLIQLRLLHKDRDRFGHTGLCSAPPPVKDCFDVEESTVLGDLADIALVDDGSSWAEADDIGEVVEDGGAPDVLRKHVTFVAVVPLREHLLELSYVGGAFSIFVEGKSCLYRRLTGRSSASVSGDW